MQQAICRRQKACRTKPTGYVPVVGFPLIALHRFVVNGSCRRLPWVPRPSLILLLLLRLRLRSLLRSLLRLLCLLFKARL
jgi:hypothetical protein